MSDTTVYLKNYQPSTFGVETVALNFDLHDDHALVHNRMQVVRQHPGNLYLHGDELELVSIQVDGRMLEDSEYERQEDDLILLQCPDKAVIEIVTRIYPQNNTQLSGLYRSKNLFCTQCEAEGFRRITYFFDRPDVLAKYTTTICAAKKDYPVLLSNGNLVDSGESDDGRHWAVWEDPFKKPSYLFALVAGELACVEDSYTTASGRHVVLRIYVDPGNEDKCGHAMTSLKKAMRWDEEVYGREYDLDIFMIVAVSDFNMGAMENKGLNIFNAKYVLARPDTATDNDFANIESIVAHEYFHNWTGNRVTCRDWFQLSLKEGLTVFRDQEFSRDMNSRDVNRIGDVQTLRYLQFPEDAGSMAHPVRPESYEEINNFYTATIYDKGAEVIRMQHTLLGKTRYRKGMDLYFDRHDGQAVTIDDFVAAMEDASGMDLSQFKLWYSQAGTPEITVTRQYANGSLVLNMEQYCPPTPENAEKKAFHIPIRVALFNSKGQPIPLKQDLLELRERQQQFEFSGLSEEPVVSLLREFSAPIKIKDDLTATERLFLLRYESDGYAKWDAAQRLMLTCMHDHLAHPSTSWESTEVLFSALRHVLLDESLDQELRAELLDPPGFEEVIASLTKVDVTAVEQVRADFDEQLGKALYDEAVSCYERLWALEDHEMNGEAYGRRALRNTCLWLMTNGNEAATVAVCQRQFATAKTMTDQIAAFSLLVECDDNAIGQQAIDDFYQQWQHDELVLDKWFSIQASCERPGALQRVKELMKHPAFSMTNPNKVRALIGAFCHGNPRHFHALDGSGYVFLREMLEALDAINPQVAARLATPFTRWQRYDDKRQALMKAQLESLSRLKLSPDLHEVVSRSMSFNI